MPNRRERFVRTLTGQDTDRVPFMKIFGGANAAHPDWEKEYPGIGKCIDKVLGFEGAGRGWIGTEVSTGATNLDEIKILDEKDDIIVRRRGDGAIEQIYKGGDYNTHTIEWPVKTMRDWQAYKERHLDPEDPSRFPADWRARVEEYKNRDYPLMLKHAGVYGFARERMGDENLAYAFYDDPAMVHDIMESYTDAAINIWEKQASVVDFDLIECWEDMASKTGSLISPDMFREFMAPCYRRIADFARAHNIKIILVDSDGLIEDLAGLMFEAGVTAMYPFEALAGNNIERVRVKCPEIGALGGLRKEAVYEGKKAIDEEMIKARKLIKLGRYIPGPDHFVLKAATFENYRYFMERLREVVMTTKPAG